MPVQTEADVAVVLDDLAAGGHRLDRDLRLVELGHRLAFRCGRPQVERLVAQRLDGP
jgi:hypothetical protein